MKKTGLAYMAGIIDGEGCIHITRKNSKGKALILSVAVGMSSPRIPYILQAHFGGVVIIRPIGQCRNTHLFWTWRVQARKALTFLDAISPYLLEKKQQAEIGICFQKNRKGQGVRVSEGQRAVEEAQRILIMNYHKHRGGLI